MIDLIPPDNIIPVLRANTKRQVLQGMAQRASGKLSVDERVIFEILLERERLGTTGVGYGVAVPHGKLLAIDRIHGLFARLERPVPFDAIDGQPVDLVFTLLAPVQSGASHLKALAKVSRFLRDAGMCAKLRGADGVDALYALLSGIGYNYE